MFRKIGLAAKSHPYLTSGSVASIIGAGAIVEACGLDFLIALAGKAMESRIGADLFVIGIVWFSQKKKVKEFFKEYSGHMGKIEDGFQCLVKSVSSMKKSVDDLKNSFENLETAHSNRLKILETSLQDLTVRVGNVENKSTTKKKE